MQILNGEFIDKDRSEIFEEYSEFIENREKLTVDIQIESLKLLIYKDKYFLYPYIDLIYLFVELDDQDRAYKLLNIAYKRLMRYLPNKKLPRKMDYYDFSNRHIFNFLFFYAEILWLNEKKVEARKLFEKIIKYTPNDPLGARYCFIGILENIASSDDLMDSKGKNLESWFQSKIRKYPKYEWLEEYLY